MKKGGRGEKLHEEVRNWKENVAEDTSRYLKSVALQESQKYLQCKKTT